MTVKVVCTILSSPETSLHWTAPHLTLIHDFSNIRLSRPGGCIDHSGSLAERRRRSPHDQAGSGIRTRNLTITKPMINHLSYLAAKRTELGEEQYLQIPCRLKRAYIAKLRSSSHDLRVEKGRYTSDRYNTALKTCRFCCSSDTDFIRFFEELPFFETPILETEDHVITECPGYHSLHSKLSDNLKSLVMLKEYRIIMDSCHTK